MNKLFHYTSINTLALILSSKKIKFNRLDKVNDTTEAMPSDYHTMAKYYFVSCWTENEEENLAMWNMYTPQMRGVRIELSLPIFNSYASDVMNNLLIPEDKLIDEKRKVFSNGGKNEPIKIVYTNQTVKLNPEIRINPNGINTDLLCRHKREIWKMEEEYRYIINFVPFNSKVNSSNYLDKDNDLIEVGFTLIEADISPSFNCEYIKITKKSFSSMKILLSPKIIDGDYEIIQSLVEKYNPDAEVLRSNLTGLIK